MHSLFKIVLLSFTTILTITLNMNLYADGNQHPYRLSKGSFFERIATFPVYSNLDNNQGDLISDETSTEISAANQDGNVVYYSNSPKRRIGLINIQHPESPSPAGFIQLDGEPTSVAVRENYLLVGINTSNSYTHPSGKLSIYSIQNPLQPEWVSDFDMKGQPDSIASSPDGQYAAIVVENERDKDFNDGLLPQSPPGHLMILTLAEEIDNWNLTQVDLTDFTQIAPNDPEPEYVSINDQNIAAISLQENNHIILVDLAKSQVINDFNAGTVNLFDIDTIEDGVINPVGTLLNRKRGPDAIAWVKNKWIATANEGDYKNAQGESGGSRGFTLFNNEGQIRYDSGSTLEHAIIRSGHYPENRSENKGNEPESVAYSRYGTKDFLFVGSERANLIAVYNIKQYNKHPKLHQMLPVTSGPEGILTIPKRNLLIISSEVDSAEDGIRSTISIFRYGAKNPDYPQLQSSRKQLIPWGALSGMSGDQHHNSTIYAVHDSYYSKSQLFKINTRKNPATIFKAISLTKNGEAVGYDLEGVFQRADGNFWMVSEGSPGSHPNLLILVSPEGDVLKEVTLPAKIAEKAKKHGFEGVTATGNGSQEKVYVAFQRAWANDPSEYTRIGVYTPANDHWAFYYYPLDSVSKGWVGLSEISSINDTTFAVIERDNQQGNDAQLKKLYTFSIDNKSPTNEESAFPILKKTLVKDLIPNLKTSNGWVIDKIEGLAITPSGNTYAVSDNDGVNDSSGETRFLRLGKVFK